MPVLANEVRQFLKQCGFRLDHRLGQNFLIDGNVLEDIVSAANIAPTDHVVEIGAGIGVLTRELVKHAQHVTTIELDERVIPLLRVFVANAKNLTIVTQNALEASYPTDPWKLVANIPYHITSPLLRRVFLESPRPPESLTLLLQREVAEKICGIGGAGMLTIVVGLFGEPHFVRAVKANAFSPPPQVDSAVLHIKSFPQPKADAATIDAVLRLTKIGFGQKRKMLRNTLGSLPEGMDRLASAQIDPTRRPQTLSIDEWIKLAAAFRDA